MTEAERKSCPWNCPIQQGLSQVTTCRKDLITHMQQEHNQYFCPHCCIRVSENLMMTHMYECKPPFSVDQLIVQAIQSSHEQQLTSSDICTYISQKYPYYKIWDKSWQEYIMTNLSNDPNFIGFPRYENRISKYFWKINSFMDNKLKPQKAKIVNIKFGQVRENFRTAVEPKTTVDHTTSEILRNVLEKDENEDKDEVQIIDVDETEDKDQIEEVKDENKDKDKTEETERINSTFAMALPGLQNAARFEKEEKVKDDQELLTDDESEVVEGWRLKHPQKSNPSESESNTTRSLPQIESKCPICNYPTGFHKLYHLATRHFKERLLATLPSVAPFKCPKCKRFNAKTRYKLWIHYLGKHNYWKKWVDEPDWQPPPKRPESEIILMPSSSPSSSSSSTETTFQCSFCKQILGNQTELTDHIDEFHSWFKCTKCCKSFSSESKWEGKF